MGNKQQNVGTALGILGAIATCGGALMSLVGGNKAEADDRKKRSEYFDNEARKALNDDRYRFESQYCERLNRADVPHRGDENND